MNSVSINLSKIGLPELDRYLQFEEKILDLEIKIDSLINSEQTSPKKINIKKFIEKNKNEMRLKQQEIKDKVLFEELIKKLEESDEKEKYENYIQKKIKINRSVNLDEIRSHNKKINEIKRRLLTEKEVEKIQINEYIKNSNEQLSMSVDYTRKRLHEFEKERNVQSEQEVIESVMKNFNKKEFSKMVQEYYKPEKKIKKENVNNISMNKITLKSQKNKRVILRKRNDNNKYNWELKLDKRNDISLNYSDNYSSKKQPIFSPVVIKTPLNKKPDYLTSARKDKENNMKENSISLDRKYDKMLKRDIDELSIYYNIEDVRLKADMIESKAKMNEILLKNSGGVKNNPEAVQLVSDLYTESIKAKLAILDRINYIK